MTICIVIHICVQLCKNIFKTILLFLGRKKGPPFAKNTTKRVRVAHFWRQKIREPSPYPNLVLVLGNVWRDVKRSIWNLRNYQNLTPGGGGNSTGGSAGGTDDRSSGDGIMC